VLSSVVLVALSSTLDVKKDRELGTSSELVVWDGEEDNFCYEEGEDYSYPLGDFPPAMPLDWVSCKGFEDTTLAHQTDIGLPVFSPLNVLAPASMSRFEDSSLVQKSGVDEAVALSLSLSLYFCLELGLFPRFWHVCLFVS
jgi:hypothetical protein